MAKRADTSDFETSAPSSWLLNPALIIFAVCIALVLATAAPDGRQSLLVLVVVAVVSFFAGRLTADKSGSR